MSNNNFLQRIVYGALVSAVVFLAVYFSHQIYFDTLFALFYSCLIVIGLWEYYLLASTKEIRPLTVLGLVGSFVYLMSIYLMIGTPMMALYPTLIMGIILFIGFLFYFFQGKRPIVNLAVTMFGLIYLTIPLSYMLLINYEFGRYWLFFLIIVTKINDVGAYLIGKKWGTHFLAPHISPNKTWEGAIAGFIIGTLTSCLLDQLSYSFSSHYLFPSPYYSIIVGAIVSIVGQLGDLFESLLKRDSGVKDSNSLPGLGGILDMLDSLIFTTPVLYFIIQSFKP